MPLSCEEPLVNEPCSSEDEHIILGNLMFPADRPVASSAPVVLHTKSTGIRRHPGETVADGTVSASPNHQSNRWEKRNNDYEKSPLRPSVLAEYKHMQVKGSTQDWWNVGFNQLFHKNRWSHGNRNFRLVLGVIPFVIICGVSSVLALSTTISSYVPA